MCLAYVFGLCVWFMWFSSHTFIWSKELCGGVGRSAELHICASSIHTLSVWALASTLTQRLQVSCNTDGMSLWRYGRQDLSIHSHSDGLASNCSQHNMITHTHTHTHTHTNTHTHTRHSSHSPSHTGHQQILTASSAAYSPLCVYTLGCSCTQ